MSKTDRTWTPSGLLRLADGREVAWDELGDPASPVVFWLHGLGDCRVSGKGMHALASEAGVRLVAPDRPGIGLSSPQPGRRLLDYPADLTALADHLGLEQYQVLGISGGGPFALACATQGDTRHFRTIVISGAGQLDKPGALESLGDATNFLRTAASGPDHAIPHLRQQVIAAENVASALDVIISTMTPEDQACVAENPDVLVDLLDSMAAAAVNGVEGIAHEAWLLTQPWGFELSQVQGPVDFFTGDRDSSVPIQHFVSQATGIADSSLTVWPRSGHMAVISHLPDLLTALRPE